MRIRYSMILLMVLPSVLLLLWLVRPVHGKQERMVLDAARAYAAVQRGGAFSRADIRKLERVVPANRPWLFDASMSRVHFNRGVLHATAKRSSEDIQSLDYRRVYTGVLTNETGGGMVAMNERQLVYPPRALWCVWLDAPNVDFVFVAEHHGLYNVEWVVHAPVRDVELTELLETVGCPSSNRAKHKSSQA